MTSSSRATFARQLIEAPRHSEKRDADRPRSRLVLTLFALPKPFQGHVGQIQRNAIRSWRRLGPAVQIILCGSDAGIAEAAAGFDAEHLPDIETNSFGTPMLHSAFRQAQDAATHDIVCYANADLIFGPDLIDAVERVSAAKRLFLVVGRSWNLEIEEEFAPFDDSCEAELRRRVAAEGVARGVWWIDFFVFRRHSLDPVPPFAVGRPGWDNWMMWRARKLRFAVVDISPSTLVIHQNHDYAHVKEARGHRWAGPEGDANKALLRRGQALGLQDATHELVADGLVPANRGGVRRRVCTALALHSATIPLYRAMLCERTNR